MKKKNNTAQLLRRIDALKAEIRGLEKLKSQKDRAEEALRKEQSFLSSVFFSIQDGISVLDRKMRIVLVNPTMERWYAHAMPLVGKKCYVAYHSRTSPCKICPTIRTLKEGGAAREIVPKRAAGGEITGWIDLYSFPLVDIKTKKVIGVIEYVRDITGSRIAEQKVEETLMRFASVIERVDEGITLSDARGHFVIYNSKMGDITGYTMQEANNHGDFLDLLYPDPEERRAARRRLGDVVRSGGVYEAETMIRAKDGTDKTLLISTSLIHHRQEDMFLSVYRDITRFKKIDELKDEFIGTVSHELRTPLSIIKEGISLMLDGIPGRINEQQAKILTSAKLNAERLTRIINDLLDISKIEAGMIEVRKETVVMADLVAQALAPLAAKAKEKNIKLQASLPAKGLRLYADPDRIMQVLTNLLDNAMKFTNEGHIEVAARRMNGGVECSVSDTGIGIAKSEIQRLFGKFEQVERPKPGEKGAGLGLSIAKKIVEMHGGRIWVESEPGRGTRVTFTVPEKKRTRKRR